MDSVKQEIKRLKRLNNALMRKVNKVIYQHAYYMHHKGKKRLEAYKKRERRREHEGRVAERTRQTFLNSIGYHKIINSKRKKGRRYLMKLTKNEISLLHHVLESGVLNKIRKINVPDNYNVFYTSPTQAYRLRSMANCIMVKDRLAKRGGYLYVLKRKPLQRWPYTQVGR